ncbi:MAG: hypothetical protein Q9175_005383 [Cornicularia normoerica]
MRVLRKKLREEGPNIPGNANNVPAGFVPRLNRLFRTAAGLSGNSSAVRLAAFRDRVKRYTADVHAAITAGNRTGGPRAAQSVEDMLRSAGLALGRIASTLEGTLDTLRWPEWIPAVVEEDSSSSDDDDDEWLPDVGGEEVSSSDDDDDDGDDDVEEEAGEDGEEEDDDEMADAYSA